MQRTWLLLPMLCVASCEARVEPVLCVADDASMLVVTDDLDAQRTTCDALAPTFTEGGAVHVLYQLAPQIDLDDALVLVLRTPCTETRLEIEHADGVARTAALVPPGGSCFLSVEASLGGQQQRRDISGDCTDVATLCDDDDEDAGAEGE